MIIGVTGGIGSGKSLLSRELAKGGAKIIVADLYARNLIITKKNLQKKIRNCFGSDYFDKNGVLLRTKLGYHVFSDKNRLDRLNNITQKPLIDEIKKQIKKIQTQNPDEMIIVDMATIFEAGIESLFDYIIVVTAHVKFRIEWLLKNKKLTKKEITDRINLQMDIEKKIEMADYVINNNKSIEELKREAAIFLTKINS